MELPKVLYQVLVRDLGKPTQSGSVTPYEVLYDGTLRSFGTVLEEYFVRETSKGKLFVITDLSEGTGKHEAFLVDNTNMDIKIDLEYWATSEDRAFEIVRTTLNIPRPSPRPYRY